MSYEGIEEFLCVNGHYSTSGCYDSHNWCPHCGADLLHRHPVDMTNGMDSARSDPMCHTRHAPKKKVGADLLWAVDKFGNPYCTEEARYKPSGRKGIWKPAFERRIVVPYIYARRKVQVAWENKLRMPIHPAAQLVNELGDDFLNGDYKNILTTIAEIQGKLPCSKS